jgi:hypothetical protein
MFHKYLLTLLTVWTSAAVCRAEEPSFSRPDKSTKSVENQWIVQFEGADDFEAAKLSTLNDISVQVVMNIDSRQLGVYKFADKNQQINGVVNPEGSNISRKVRNVVYKSS